MIVVVNPCGPAPTRPEISAGLFPPQRTLSAITGGVVNAWLILVRLGD
jgi:hypothetical protein